MVLGYLFHRHGPHEWMDTLDGHPSPTSESPLADAVELLSKLISMWKYTWIGASASSSIHLLERLASGPVRQICESRGGQLTYLVAELSQAHY